MVVAIENATKPSRAAHFWQGAHPSRLPCEATSEPPKVVRTWSVLYILTSNVLRATTACTFLTSEPPKVVRTWGALYILTSKCASRHNGVHFFDIWTSKSGPRMMCFVTCWLRNVLRATTACTFRHLNFQKWSEAEVVCTFWLGNVLRAHNGVQFFISHLASWLRTRRFSEPTFRPSGLKSVEKNSVLRLSYLFAHLHLLSSDSFSSLIFSLLIFLFSLPLPCSAFHLSILSEVWLLNFLR